jgi:hypothetical protein
MRATIAVTLVACLVAIPVAHAAERAPTHGFEAARLSPEAVTLDPAIPGAQLVSPLALETGLLAARPMSGDANKKGSTDARFTGLSGERAQALLRSLTLPGWGQASLGHKTSAMLFGVVEAGVWTSFAAFKIQQSMRTESYMKTAELYAGINLDGYSDEYRRMIGIYPSSDDYNKYVVYRDAANLYYDDPEAYNAYIAKNSVSGEGGWRWASPESFERYQEQRKEVTHASQNANLVLAVAIANRLLSALHAARIAGHTAPVQGLHFDIAPDPADPSRYAFALRTSF